MKSHLPALLIAVLALAGWAADSHAQTPDVTGFEFAIRETGSLGQEQPADPRMILTIVTNENYCGWSLPVQVDVTGDFVSLDVSDPVPPPPDTACIPEGAPAEFDMPLDLAAGDYTVGINWHGMTDTYDLAVNDEYTQLTAKNATFTSPHFNEMFGPYSLDASYSVPGYSRWYSFPRDSFIVTCGGLTGDEQFCNAFFAQMQSLDVTPLDLASDGIWPFPTQINGNYYDAPTRLYKYSNDGVWDEAKQKLAGYINGVFSTCGRSVALENWRDDFADSWLIRDTGCDYPYSGTPTAAATIDARAVISGSSPTHANAPPSVEPPKSDDTPTSWIVAGLAGFGITGIVILTLLHRRSRKSADQDSR